MKKLNNRNFRLYPALSLSLLFFSLIIQPSRAAESRIVTAGEKLKASSLHKAFLGKDYRDLWVTPIEVDVLDLREFSGGLVPVRPVGAAHNQSLILKGTDGREYLFRGMNRDRSSALPVGFKGALEGRFNLDQNSAAFPAAPVIVGRLAQTAGLLHPGPRLVVLPEDNSLGEFREAYGGVLGTIEEYPAAGTGLPENRYGAEEIIGHVDMWSRILEGPAHRIDALSFLRARLFDILIGDWDRRRSQWRWARLPGGSNWQPIPENRDQAFSSYEGFLLFWARYRHPQLVTFSGGISNLEGLTLKGRDMDRWILSELDLPDWMNVVSEIQKRLNDTVIDVAVRLMPEEYFPLIGERLALVLKKRRDVLRDVAYKYYMLLAGEVDIHATDSQEVAQIHHSRGGSVEVNLYSTLGGRIDERPFFSREFRPLETKEIRIYLHAGDDRVDSTGTPGGEIKIRIIGGEGEDRVDDSQSGGVFFYDSGANTFLQGEDSRWDSRPYTRPRESGEMPWVPPRDWGRRTTITPILELNSDIGLFLGGRLVSRGYGFRRYPFADSHSLFVGISSMTGGYEVDYRGIFHRLNSPVYTTLSAYATGIEFLHFHGYGNEIPSDKPDEFYRVRQNLMGFSYTFRFPLFPRIDLFFGPDIKHSQTVRDTDSFLVRAKPYGSTDLGAIGLKFSVLGDLNEIIQSSRFVTTLSLQGYFYPKLWNVKSLFGGLEGVVRMSIPLTDRLTAATRLGGKVIFGRYPYHEAATIGGTATVRGLPLHRYYGDSSLYGNLELRLKLGKGLLFLPGEYGIFVLGDVGRVFLEGEVSRRWHSAFGGGIFFSLIDLASVFSLTVAHSEGRTAVYFGSGYSF